LASGGKYDKRWAKNLYIAGFQEVMNTEKLLSREELGNGLVLEVWDHSRPVAGDRWQVKVEIRIAVPVTPPFLPPALADSLTAIRAALGDVAVFTQVQERNFIAAPEVNGVVEEMQTRLTSLGREYAGRPDFPGKFLARRFSAHLARQGWWGS